MNRWLAGLIPWRSRSERPAACVYLSRNSVAVAMGRRQGERYRLDLRADPVASLADAEVMLRQQSQQLGLADTTCNLVLAPDLYTVSLVERPPVADAELRDAVRWRIQETVDFAVDQAALDVFPLPECVSRERSMVFVVALRKDNLRRYLDNVYAAGITVGSVDISELALRNLAYGMYPDASTSVGLLRLTGASGVINISRGEELFLARRVSGMPAELSPAAWNEFKDRLLLQVQRSIDYYESSMGQPPCSALVVATTHGWQDNVCEYLDDMLPLSVRALRNELGALFDICLHNPEASPIDWNAVSDTQANALTAALPALGGLMRAVHDQTPAALESAA